MKRMELIQKNFARLRAAKGCTQEQLAEIGRVSKGYIGAIEAGLAKSFSARAEDKWARIFGVSIAEFFLGPGQIIMNAQELRDMMKKPVTDKKLQQQQSDLQKKGKELIKEIKKKKIA